MTYYLSIDYQEPEEEGETSLSAINYKGVVLEKGNSIFKRFNSGCPVTDYDDFIEFSLKNQLIVRELSSFNHFIMDVRGYKTEYDENHIERIVKMTKEEMEERYVY